MPVCLVHGRDKRASALVEKWLRAYVPINLEPKSLASEGKVGALLPPEIEQWGRAGDVAIVLATPDDMGHLVGDEMQKKPRARQNVWMEYGWFWGRLGADRTALLMMDKEGSKGNHVVADKPTDIDGVRHIEFSDYNLGSISKKHSAAWYLDRFLRSCWSETPGDVTELRRARHNPRSREQEWNQIHLSAEETLTITGIAMVKLTEDLESVFEIMGKKGNSIHLTLVPVDAMYLEENEDVFTNLHRRNTVNDNVQFYKELATLLTKRRRLADRITLVPYRGVPPFAATIADGGWRSSRLMVQPFVPNPKPHPQAHPRFELVARTEQGVYQLYWSAVERMISRSDNLTGRDAILEYTAGIA